MSLFDYPRRPALPAYSTDLDEQFLLHCQQLLPPQLLPRVTDCLSGVVVHSCLALSVPRTLLASQSRSWGDRVLSLSCPMRQPHLQYQQDSHKETAPPRPPAMWRGRARGMLPQFLCRSYCYSQLDALGGTMAPLRGANTSRRSCQY